MSWWSWAELVVTRGVFLDVVISGFLGAAVSCGLV